MKRYKTGGYGAMIEDEDGPWVRFEDVPSVDAPQPRQAQKERYTPARLAFCEAVRNACLDKFRGGRCALEVFGHEACVVKLDAHDWCPKCLLGEAAVQIEWLLTKVDPPLPASSSTQKE